MGDFGKNPPPKLIDAEPALPADRDERYSVAVLNVHYHSFRANRVPASLRAPAGKQDEPRQLECPPPQTADQAA